MGDRIQAAHALNGAEANHVLAIERLEKARAAADELARVTQHRTERLADLQAAALEATTPEARLGAVLTLDALLAEVDETRAKAEHRIRCELGTAETEASKATDALVVARSLFRKAVQSAAQAVAS